MIFGSTPYDLGNLHMEVQMATSSIINLIGWQIHWGNLW